jgi:predicted AAA+ superfamily ATPase
VISLQCFGNSGLKWKQFQPVETELYFYRTAAGLEVDSLLANERTILPIEAKASERVTAADGRSVETFMAEHPPVAKVGLVVDRGNEVVELRQKARPDPDASRSLRAISIRRGSCVI